jgi:ABC-type nitrate/sulfonate/bicarbonate transport system substrate-binding protein
VKINIGRIALIANAPFFVMEKLRLIEKMSDIPVAVTYITTGSGSFLIQGLAAGQLDFAVMGTAPALVVAAKQDSNIKIIGPDATWFCPLLTWHDDIRTLSDVKPGMKIGSPGGLASNPGVLLLKRWLELGRSIDDLRGTLVSAGQGDLVKAFQNHQLDLWWSTEPVLGMRVSGARILTTFDDALGEPLVVTVNVGSTKFAGQYPKLFAVYLKALDAAYKWTVSNPEQTAEIVGSALKIPAETVLKALKVGKYRWDLNQKYSSIQTIAVFMKQQNLIDESNIQSLWFKETWR